MRDSQAQRQFETEVLPLITGMLKFASCKKDSLTALCERRFKYMDWTVPTRLLCCGVHYRNSPASRRLHLRF